MYNIADKFVAIHLIEIVLNQDNSNKVNFPIQIHDQDIELPIVNHILFRSIFNKKQKPTIHSHPHPSNSFTHKINDYDYKKF